MIDIITKFEDCNMIKWFQIYVLSLRRDIVNLIFFDCVFLLVMELWLRRIPAPYTFFVKVGDVFITLGISLLASFVFYFVQVHLPETKQKNDLNPVIFNLFHRMILAQKTLLTEFVNVKPFESLTEDKIREGFSLRDVNKQGAPLIFAGSERNANWMEYGFYHVSDIDKNWEMLMKYSSFMDSELLSILSRIQNNSALGFFRTMRGIYPTLKYGMKLNGFDDGLVELWLFIQEEDAYYSKFDC